jgi:5-methylcytosine-specific restriction endonuclease McrA
LFAVRNQRTAQLANLLIIGIVAVTLSQRSRRALIRQARRVAVARKVLAARPRCERCLDAPSKHVHEIKSRARGGSVLDTENMAALCRDCHQWVHAHPKKAAEAGLSKWSWSP